MTDRHDVINATIKAHRKRTIQGCACGWGQLGKDHADHLALAVEAGCDFYAMGERDLPTIIRMIGGTLALVESSPERP